MEGVRSKPETVSASPGTPLTDTTEKTRGQTDSFLTAARLVRRGWTEEGNETGGQFSHFDCYIHQPSLSRSDENQGPNQVEKDPWSRWDPVVNNRKISEERVTGIVYVWMPGCRITRRQSRRFKAPLLPVIAEI